MGRSFEDILAECLEAVAQGHSTVDDCLALYPENAERLESELRLGLGLRQAYASQAPQPDFQAAARQRFLSAARAPEALRAPSSIQARIAGLVSAVRLRLAPPTLAARPALAVAAVLLIFFVGFSSYVAATAGDTLPGDWRYPAKRLGEQVRLSFSLGDETKRSVRISITEERLWEVENLAAKGRPIGDRLLRELANSTDSLVQDLDPVSVPPQQIERISDLTAQQQEVLEQVEPLVEEKAVDELDLAKQVSSEGHEKAVFALALAGSPEEGGETAVGAEATATGTPASPTPGASVLNEPTPAGTPSAGATPVTPVTPGNTPLAEPTLAGTPSAEPTGVPEVAEGETPTMAPDNTGEPTPEPTPTPPVRERIPLTDDTTGGITWSLLSVGDFSVRVPAPEEQEWVVSNFRPGQEGETVFVGHRWGNRFDDLLCRVTCTNPVRARTSVPSRARHFS